MSAERGGQERCWSFSVCLTIFYDISVLFSICPRSVAVTQMRRDGDL